MFMHAIHSRNTTYFLSRKLVVLFRSQPLISGKIPSVVPRFHYYLASYDVMIRSS
jgi:hypothetical protein